MQIPYVEITGFTRFNLAKIWTLILTPTEIVQLILGSNGVGKSSLLGELTPLPPNASDYAKDGRKEIHIRAHGCLYKFIYTFKSGIKCTMWKDDELLNEEGTQSVQRELIRQEFNITPQTHALISGQEKFHSMSPSRRREWFTNLSVVSYEYAISVFNKLNTNHRDTLGALKLAKKRVVVEIAKLLPEEEELKLIEEVEKLQLSLNDLQSKRGPVAKSSLAIKSEIETQLEGLDRLAISINQTLRPTILSTIYYTDFTSAQDIDNRLVIARDTVTKYETLNKNEMHILAANQEAFNVLSLTGEEALKELGNKHRAICDEITSYRTNVRAAMLVKDPTIAIADLTANLETLAEVFNNISSNEDKKFSIEALNLANRKRDDLLRSRDLLIGNIATYEARLEHIEAHRKTGTVTCEKCNHSWTPGHSEATIVSYNESLSRDKVTLEETKSAVAEIDNYLEEIATYRQHYRTFKTIANSTTSLGCLWEIIDSTGYLISNPRKLISVVNNFLKDLEILVKIRELQVQLNEVEHLMDLSKEVGVVSISDLKLRIEESETKINTYNKYINDNLNLVSNYTAVKRALNSFINQSNLLTENMNTIDSLTKKMVIAKQREIINDAINSLQTELAVKSEALNNLTRQKDIVADLERTIDEYAKNEEALKLLISELSPTNGLIAEGLLGFINTFIKKMNAIIKKTWSYRLEVLSCSFDGENSADLDYKFPVLVKHVGNVSPDVSKLSTGQEEMIDLAFKLVAARYLGLQDAPMILDEWGASLDEAHRVSSMNTLKTLVESNAFTQLFMVSHYVSSYGALNNPEITVLCPNNISIPKDMIYNRNVTLLTKE